MGKPTAKNKNQAGSNSSRGNAKKGKSLERTVSFDDDTAVFINMSKELKEEGNKLFQKRDVEGAILKYEKSIKLLPANHIDVAYLRNNIASCYMQMGIGEFPRAIKECNMALEVAPKYSKALLRRARCYEALNNFDLSMKDVNTVLAMEPNNSNALELADRLRNAVEVKGVPVEGKEDVFPSPGEFFDPSPRVAKEKPKKKKNSKVDLSCIEETEEKKLSDEEGKNHEDKAVVEEKTSINEEKLVIRAVKLVHGEDIRWAHVPVNCSVRLLRDVVVERFHCLRGVLIKYKDQEGDLVTITTTDELRIAEGLNDGETPLRLYIAEVSPDKEPFYEGVDTEEQIQRNLKPSVDVNGAKTAMGYSCVEDWIIHFASMFKNHVGFECDSYLDLHEIGMKLYSEAMEDTVTGEDAQELFDIALSKFQEMTALALFNWGNVHLSKARKKISPDNSSESLPISVKSAYEWAQNEYAKAGSRYEESLKLKPDFYEGLLALGLLQFEQAKLSWYYIFWGKCNIDIQQSSEVLELYNRAEDSIERGMQLWEETEEQRLNGLSKGEKDKAGLIKFGLDGLLNHIPSEEASKQAANMRSQIYLLWGTILYERSVVEYKLSLPTWQECLEVAVEKFQLAGSAQTDIAVMIKNHCSNETALEGFKVDEIVQAWNEMYDDDRWRSNVSYFRLEPLLRRRPPKLLSLLEHI